MNKRDLIILRPATNGDINFILATWMKGLKHGGNNPRKEPYVYGVTEGEEEDRYCRECRGFSLFKEIEDEAFKNYETVIRNLLQKGNVMVACLKEDTTVVLGYSVTRPGIIDWVYVKGSWRNLGLARDLVIECNPKSVSHLTWLGNMIRRRKLLIFNPFTINNELGEA